MVNSKKRDILERYRHFLENNLILTEDLLRWFQEKKILPNFIFEDIKTLTSASERNKRFLTGIIDNGDVAFTRLVEGLVSNGQPFLGELLESEDKKSVESSADASERVVIDGEMLKRCPGIDRLRADTRDKLKTYLQEQLLKAHLNDTWKSQTQNKSVEVINLKRQHYESQQKLVDTIEEEKRQVVSLKDTLRHEQQSRQRRDDEMKELKTELNRLQSEFDQKWSTQIRMADANNRSVFKMNDKMSIVTDWLRTLDHIFKINTFQTGFENDSVDQLQTKLKRYTAELESLRNRGVGTDKLKEELYEAIYSSRYLPIEDRKNQSFHDLLVRLYGSNQVTELAVICTKDLLQSRLERDQANEIRIRDVKIEELNRLNRTLQAEIDRLKARSPSPTEQSLVKPKPQWRPVPASIPIKPREKPKARQALKPISMQLDAKPEAN